MPRVGRHQHRISRPKPTGVGRAAAPLEEQPEDPRDEMIREFVLDQLRSGMEPAKVADLVPTMQS